jgi:hypothetical protein
MAHAELAGAHHDLDLRRKVEQSQHVSHVAARFGDDPPKRLLGVAIFLDQPLVGLRLLDRVEVLALDILDQRNLKRLRVGKIAHDRRDLMQLRLLRRAPASLARDDLEAVAVRPHHNRLDDAARLDRGGELVERLLAENAARLARVRLNARDRNTAHVAAAQFAGDRRFT